MKALKVIFALFLFNTALFGQEIGNNREICRRIGQDVNRIISCMEQLVKIDCACPAARNQFILNVLKKERLSDEIALLVLRDIVPQLIAEENHEKLQAAYLLVQQTDLVKNGVDLALSDGLAAHFEQLQKMIMPQDGKRVFRKKREYPAPKALPATPKGPNGCEPY